MRREIAFVFALGACGAGDTTIDRTFDPCALAIAPIDGATSIQRAGITDALALWGVTAADGPTIEVRFETAALSFHGLYDDEAGVVFVNDRITDPRALAIVIAHELGHAFGLPHLDDRPSVMGRGNVTVEPTLEDVDRVVALWGACPTSSSAPLRTSRHR